MYTPVHSVQRRHIDTCGRETVANELGFVEYDPPPCRLGKRSFLAGFVLDIVVSLLALLPLQFFEF